jgi:hypothetical protein
MLAIHPDSRRAYCLVVRHRPARRPQNNGSHGEDDYLNFGASNTVRSQIISAFLLLAVAGEIGLLVSGYRVLMKETLVRPGEYYLVEGNLMLHKTVKARSSLAVPPA